jgi:hypothetical protein
MRGYKNNCAKIFEFWIKGNFKDVSTDRRITLKFILKKYGETVFTGSNGEFFEDTDESSFRKRPGEGRTS